MTLRREVLGGANRLLNTFGVHLLPRTDYDTLRSAYDGPRWTSPHLPAAARDHLRWDNPALIELEKRYDGHPAAGHTQWRRRNLQSGIDLTNFRGDNHYVYQTRWSPGEATYFMTAYYVRDHDRLGLFGKLQEDGLFGAYTVRLEDGYVVSRDLLDSINQANAIFRFLGRTPDEPLRLLDIGAGYGRLAQRLTEGFASTHVTCTDAVPLSTFLSEFYLRFRGSAERTEVVPLDMVGKKLAGTKFDMVTNIHSFPECPLTAIAWWLDQLGHLDVGKLLMVPNRADQFLSTEPDGRHLDFLPLLLGRGWKLVHSEPIYAHSVVAQRCALYPNFRFHLFERC